VEALLLRAARRKAHPAVRPPPARATLGRRRDVALKILGRRNVSRRPCTVHASHVFQTQVARPLVALGCYAKRLRADADPGSDLHLSGNVRP
jgi:hypothetical protein